MKKYEVYARDDGGFGRSGRRFHQQYPTILTEAQMTPEILAEPRLRIVEIAEAETETTAPSLPAKSRGKRKKHGAATRT